MNRRHFLEGLAAGSAWLCAGCGPLPALETVHHPAPNKPDTRRLVVMLPGFGDSPEDLDDHGFVGLLPRARVDADVITVNARMSHYLDRSLLPALRTSVIEPAREHGYESIWFLGISMGGLGALLAAREFEKDVDGATLLSPYLGSGKTLKKIKSAGGPTAWAPPAEPSDDYSVELWRWLKSYAQQAGSRPHLFLGYGTQESNPGYELLSELLPKNRVVTHDGRHKWKTWEQLLPQLLSRGALQV